MSQIDFSKIYLNKDGGFRQPEEIAESLLLIKDINQSYNIKLAMIEWLKIKGHETSFLPEIKAVYDHARELSGIGVGREIREEDFLILMERCDTEGLSAKFRKPNFRNYKKSLLKLMNYMDLDAESRIDKAVFTDLEKNGLYHEVLDGIREYINRNEFYFKGQIYDKAVESIKKDGAKDNVFSLNFYPGELSSKEHGFLNALGALKIEFNAEGKYSSLVKVFRGEANAEFNPDEIDFIVSDSRLDEVRKIKHLIMGKITGVQPEFRPDDFTVVCSDEQTFKVINNLFFAEQIPAYSSYKYALNDISTDVLRLIKAGIEGDAQSILNFYNLYIANEPIQFSDMTGTDIRTLYTKLMASKSDLKLKLKKGTNKDIDDLKKQFIKDFLKLLNIDDEQVSVDKALSVLNLKMNKLNDLLKFVDKKIELEIFSYKEPFYKIFGDQTRKFSEYIEYLYLISSKSNKEKLNKDMAGVRISMMTEPGFSGKFLIFADMSEGNFLKASNPIGILKKDNFFSMYKSIYGVDPEQAVFENFRILTSGTIERVAMFVPQWGDEFIPSTKIDKILELYPKNSLNIEIVPEKEGLNDLSADFSVTLKDRLEDTDFGKLETTELKPRPAQAEFTIALREGNIEKYLVSPSKVESFMSCPAKHVHDLNLSYDQIESQMPYTKGNFFHSTTESFLKHYKGKDLLTGSEYSLVTGILSSNKGIDKIANERYKEFCEFYWSGLENEKFNDAYIILRDKIRGSGADAEIDKYLKIQTENDPYGYFAYEKQKYEIIGFIARLIITMGETPAEVTNTFSTEVKFGSFIIAEDPEIRIREAYIDFMFVDRTGNVRIFDIKSTKKFEEFEDEILNYQKVQILIYREAVSRRLKNDGGVSFNVLNDGNNRDCTILPDDYFNAISKDAVVTADYISSNKPYILSSREQNFCDFQKILTERLNDLKHFLSLPNSGCEYCSLAASCPDNEQSKFDRKNIETFRPSDKAENQFVQYSAQAGKKTAGNKKTKKFIIFSGDKEKAVSLNENMIISAGAGAGKTEVLSSRYVNTLINHDADTEDIVCITFTKKAAGEMQKRIYSKLNDVIESGFFFVTDLGSDPEKYKLDEKKKAKLIKIRDVFYENNLISTFHSFCNKFISDYGYSSERLKNFDVAQDLSDDYRISGESVKFLKREFDNGFNEILSDSLNGEEYAVFNDWLTSRHLVYSGDFEGGFIPDILSLYAEMKLSGRELEQSQWLVPLDNYISQIEERFRKEASDYIGLKKQAIAMLEEEIGSSGQNEKLSSLKDKISADQDFTYKSILSEKKYPELREIVTELTETQAYEYINKKSVDLSLNGNEWMIKKAVFGIISALNGYISEYKASKGLLEQNDLHLHFLEMLKDDDVRSELHKRFRYILVDEFQDTNWLQDKILEKLKTAENKYFLVGDRKQSIYRFQQCDVQIFEKYLEKFRVLHFSDNFRSSPQIVDFNNSVFSPSAANGYNIIKDKNELSRTPEGKVSRYPSSVNFVNINSAGTKELVKGDESYELTQSQMSMISKMAEAAFVADTILKNCENGRNFGDWAVLIRKYTHIGFITEAFRKKNIPYTLILKRDLFILKEVTEFINILKTAMKVISPAEIEFLQGSDSLLQSIKEGDPLICVIYKIFSHEIYRNYLASFPDYETKLANIEILIENLLGLLTESENDRERFLTELEKSIRNNSAGVVVQKPDAVTIMTVHSAKGLEFENLILANVDEYDKNQTSIFNYLNLWQKDSNYIEFSMTGYKSATGMNGRNFFKNEYIKFKNKDFDATERANLLYVALTRAKNSLTVVIQTKNESDGSYEEDKVTGWAKYLNKFGAENNGKIEGFSYIQKDISEFDLSGYFETGAGSENKYHAEKNYDAAFEAKGNKIDSATGLSHKDDEVTHEKGNTTAIDTGNFLHLFMSKKISVIFKPDFQLETELKEFKKTDTESNSVNIKTVQKMIENIKAEPLFKKYAECGHILCEKNIVDTRKNLQGYIDLVLLCGDEVIVLDYKTYLYNFPDIELVAKYKHQVNIYADALSKIYPDKAVKKYLFFIGKDKAELKEIN
jgi:ATP-dependent helicase/nuclease subunit A